MIYCVYRCLMNLRYALISKIKSHKFTASTVKRWILAVMRTIMNNHKTDTPNYHCCIIKVTQSKSHFNLIPGNIRCHHYHCLVILYTLRY